MELLFASDKVEEQCTCFTQAKKLFGGNKALSISLLARINALAGAETLKDIVIQRQFRFHRLEKKGKKDLEGYFAIDVKSPKEPWRIILQPLDKNKMPFHPCYIDQISGIVRIVEITEVSKHYE